MARRSKMSVQKRLRERKKAEKAAIKREERSQREPDTEGSEDQVATQADLEGYGLVVPEDEEEEQEA
jgi:hypothetical protein